MGSSFPGLAALAFLVLCGCGLLGFEAPQGPLDGGGVAVDMASDLRRAPEMGALDEAAGPEDAAPLDTARADGGASDVPTCSDGSAAACSQSLTFSPGTRVGGTVPLESARDNFAISCAEDGAGDGGAVLMIQQPGRLRVELTSGAAALAFLRGNCGGETIVCGTENTLELDVRAGEVITVALSALSSNECARAGYSVTMTR